ncbi:hypothetical protein HPMKF10_1162, partial [Helicobacter pylori]
MFFLFSLILLPT